MSKTYTTVQGDMWDSVAYQQLGNSTYTDRLINANMQYRNYYIFPAGVVLEIPEVEESGSSELPPWKQ